MKMNQVQRKYNTYVRPGTVIKGKWHGKRYRIMKQLGKGAVGTVYLCEIGGQLKALKMSEKTTSMTVEVNVLKSLQQVQGNRLGPSLFDIDDWISPDDTIYSFYVMEYLKGESLNHFLKKNGHVWIGVLMLQLLEDLERLHQSGWVFGDLKLDNLIVLPSPTRIRWVDVGGTTQIGRAIKEFTEFYDRGYWGMGTRKAEPSYDLFSFVMVFLHVYYPNQFQRGTQSEKLLTKKIDQVKALSPYRAILKSAIQGNYASSTEMKRDVLKVVHSFRNKTANSRQSRKKKSSNIPFLIEIGGISFLACIYYLLSLWF